MQLYTLTGEYDTEELHKNTNQECRNLEENMRVMTDADEKHIIGYAIPLGTLGNAPDKEKQFKSDFTIVAYTISDNLVDKHIDFNCFNVLKDVKEEAGQIGKLRKELRGIAEHSFGVGWNITFFNVDLQTVVKFMCKEKEDADSIKKASEDLINIIQGRVNSIKLSTQDNVWKHEIVDLFYMPIPALSCKFTKLIQSGTGALGKSNKIVIEALVYDAYANGLRLLSNEELYISYKIRMYTNNLQNSVYAYVLKAGIDKADHSFIPIRQFNGESIVANTIISSGCSRRIVYDIINKNYTHWTFLTIPKGLKIELHEQLEQRSN